MAATLVVGDRGIVTGDERLRALESWLASVLGSVADGIVTVDRSGMVTFINPVAARMTGAGDKEVTGTPLGGVLRISPAGKGDELARRVRAAIAGEVREAAPLNCTLVSPAGVTIPVECTVNTLAGAPGCAGGAVLVVRDITERVRGQEAILESERKYRELFENSAEGVFHSTPDGVLISANSRLAHLFGYATPEELMAGDGRNTAALYADPGTRGELIRRLAAAGTVEHFEFQSAGRDGAPGRWFSMNARAIRDAKGTLAGLEGTLLDITERMRALEALKTREAHLRAILDNSPDTVWLKDARGVYLDLNARLAKEAGRENIDAIRGKTDFDLYAEKEARAYRAADEEVMRSGSRLFLDEEVDGQGQKHFIETFKSPITDAGGNVIGVCGFSRDITEARGNEELIRKLTRAVDQSPSTIVITDTKGTIEYVNPRFTVLTGYTSAEAIGQNPRMLNAGKLPRGVYEGLWKTLASGKEWSGELLNRKKNGELFWENATIAPVRDDRGVVTHYVAIKEDITRRKETEAELARRAEDILQAKSRAEEQAIRLGVQAFELRKAREEALKASKLKSEFVANMSHEIRTPMNGVLGMAGLLLDTGLNSEQREYAEIIRTSGEALLSIVNDILDFSKIEAGKLELEAIDFNLRATVEESIDLVAMGARQKGLTVRCELADGVPDALRGDPGRLRQVLTNLLSNAVKFTDHGEVTVGVSPGGGDNGVAGLKFTVRDTGIGISEEERSRLFRPFSQADGSTTRKHGGTGLGLVIAKQLVEMMGGEIGVSSRKGTGSEFWFTVRMPVSSPAAPGADGGSRAREAEPLEGGERSGPRRLRRVLVAEDNQINQRVALRMLEKMGYRADVVANGKEAVEAVTRLPYDLVLMDCQMPVMDGFEATASIRKLNGRGGKTLVIAMTANALRGDRERCIASGMDDYLAKPVTQEALENLLAKWDLMLTEADRTSPAADAPQPGDGLDREKIAELRELGEGDSPEWLETLVRHFLRDTAGRLAKLHEAYAGRDARAFEEVAHALKGSCATLGVTSMKVTAERLQAMGRSGALEGAEPLIADLERALAVAERRLEEELLHNTEGK